MSRHELEVYRVKVGDTNFAITDTELKNSPDNDGIVRDTVRVKGRAFNGAYTGSIEIELPGLIALTQWAIAEKGKSVSGKARESFENLASQIGKSVTEMADRLPMAARSGWEKFLDTLSGEGPAKKS